MLTKYIKGINRTQCVIFDVDGCLADCTHRLHLIEGIPDWEKFFALAGADSPIKHNLLLLSLLYHNNVYIVLMTGRPESIRTSTEEWARTLGSQIGYDRLLMRQTGDYRPDHVVKREMVHKLRSEGFEIILAFDDRAHVVDMFIEEGIPCLHVRAPDAKMMENVAKYERKVKTYIPEGAPGTYENEGPEAA